MSLSRQVHVTTAVLALGILFSFSANAQEGETFVRVTPTEGKCPTGAYSVGYIGYKDLECNCSFSIGPDGPHRYEFRTEPTIGGIEPGSPAEGNLFAGDIITAIDGYLITTREGGRRFARLDPGDPTTLTVRRHNMEVDVRLVPASACYEVESPPPPRTPSPAVDRANPPTPPRRAPEPAVPPRPTPHAPTPPHRPTVVAAEPARPTTPTPAPPPPPDVSSGWVGFSIRCTECRVGRENGLTVWEFLALPEVDRVERQSPAYSAGIRSGDILTHINGHPFTSLEGARSFSAVEPGDTVTFRLMRNNTVLESQIVANERQRREAWNVFRPDSALPTHPPVTRFSGVVGDTHVLVTGGPVSVNRTDDEVVIQAGDITVRIKRTGRTEESRRNQEANRGRR